MTPPLDPALRELFEEEAAEELAGIEAVLPDAAADAEAAQALYRHAHTLKGSAAVVGMPDVCRIAEILETIFDAVRTGRREVTPSFQEAILATVTDLRYIVSGALAGLDVGGIATDVELSLSQLDGPAGAPAEPTPSTAPAPPGDLLEAIAAAQLATMRLVAERLGVDATATPEYRGLAALLTGAPARTTGRGTVLVVEDSPTVRERHRAILAEGGYDVRTAADGAEALDLLEAQPADAVVTDLEMPALDGWQLTSAIRTRPALAGMGIVVVSSRGDDDARRRSAGAGADAYLVKTVEPDRLLGSVARVLDGAA